MSGDGRSEAVLVPRWLVTQVLMKLEELKPDTRCLRCDSLASGLTEAQGGRTSICAVCYELARWQGSFKATLTALRAVLP